MRVIQNICLILLSAVLLSGCILRSLNPFYTEGDVVFDDILIGTWIDQDSSIWEVKQHKISKGWFTKEDSLVNSYRICFTEDKERSIFEAHLFNLNGEKYIDFTPLMDELFKGEFYSLHLMPAHSLAKLEISDDNHIQMRWFNEAWLVEMYKEHHLKLPYKIIQTYENEQSYLLTAETEELQKFLLKYGQDPKATTCEKGDGICAKLTRQ